MSLFSRSGQPKPPEGRYIYIDGSLYCLDGGSVVCFNSATRRRIVCDVDHVTPNGVPVRQICIALMIAEGAISGLPAGDYSRIGLN